jgi:hypothetical protein
VVWPDDIPEKDRLDNHRRMHDEVLQTDRFPEIVLRAAGDFAVGQTGYHITLVSAAAGTIGVKDELKCKFDIAARKHG